MAGSTKNETAVEEETRPRAANEALRKLWTTQTLGIAIGWFVLFIVSLG
jgi:hypothetical protein